jgi:ribonuclease R
MIDVLKNHILHLLQKDGTARKRSLLEQELGIGLELQAAFAEALDALCADGMVIVNQHEQVSLSALSNEASGIFKAHARGYGFVTPQQCHMDEDLFIPAKATAGAMTGDQVLVQVKWRQMPGGETRLTGKVVQIMERANASVVGMLRQEQDAWLVQPDGGDFFRPIQVEGIDQRKLRHGDKVAVQIHSYPKGTEPAQGVVTGLLGRTGRHGAEISAILRRYHLREDFGPSALVEACNAQTDFQPRAESGRVDITDELVITIDPVDAQDFDDAISLTRNAQGFWVLGVHIADVSHFVAPGSALDEEARTRGNSVYLPGKTIPMLPEMLSNGICSLQAGQRRYTKSVYLTYNRDGTLMATRFANTMINSRARLSYEQASAVFKGKRLDLPDEVVALLQDMESLARAIEERRRRAHMLQLDMPVTEVVLDESGAVTDVQFKDTSYAHTVIEMFMVEANVAVACLLDRYCIPFMRRIHPEPNAKALRQLSQTLRIIGVTLSRQPQRSDLQRLLGESQDSRLALPVKLLVLRSLEKAVYSGMNVGHYALAVPLYCHFTSPIRRYADLMVHRALHDYLCGRLDHARLALSVTEINDIGEHISDTERTAEEAEHELKTILILHLLKKHIGAELNGIVVNLTGFGVQVQLPDYGVEGLIRCEDLGADAWQFHEQSQCLVGRHTGALIRLAQTLRVRIAAVHATAGQLDLTPVTDLIKKLPRKTKPAQGRGRRSTKRGRGRRRR